MPEETNACLNVSNSTGLEEDTRRKEHGIGHRYRIQWFDTFDNLRQQYLPYFELASHLLRIFKSEDKAAEADKIVKELWQPHSPEREEADDFLAFIRNQHLPVLGALQRILRAEDRVSELDKIIEEMRMPYPCADMYKTANQRDDECPNDWVPAQYEPLFEQAMRVFLGKHDFDE
jgi:hypothetical protein